MPSLALRNLLHDRVRLVVTLTGIVFSVVLSAVQLGLFVGFRRATSDLIAMSRADIWVKSEGVTRLESAVAFPEAWRYHVLATPGVMAAEKYIANFGQWKRPDGAEEGIMVIGLEPTATMGRPWNLTAGRVEDLEQPDAVIVDELYLAKLGVGGVGDTAEIRGHRVRIVGLTRGIRTFTTAPPVFTLFKRAIDFTGLTPDQTLYVLVRAGDGVDSRQLPPLSRNGCRMPTSYQPPVGALRRSRPGILRHRRWSDSADRGRPRHDRGHRRRRPDHLRCDRRSSERVRRTPRPSAPPIATSIA